MAPQKSLPASKVALVLSFFRTTAVAHTLKDLEKSLPAAAGISSMAVKDYINHLTGESLLSVEKIGSGNWYWSFPSDAQKAKERMIDEARRERDKLKRAIEELEVKKAELEGEEEDVEEKEKMLETMEKLEKTKVRREELRKKVETLKDGIIEVGAAEKMKDKANVLIDNIMVLMDYAKNLLQNDKEQMAFLRQEFGIEEDLDYLEL